jgi:hypothetical protein
MKLQASNRGEFHPHQGGVPDEMGGGSVRARPPFLTANEVVGLFKQGGVFPLLAEIATRCKLTPEVIVSRSRERRVCEARRELCRRLRADGFSWEAIGDLLDRDYSTLARVGRNAGMPYKPRQAG